MIFTTDDIVQELAYWAVYYLLADESVRNEIRGAVAVNPDGDWINAEEIFS